MTFIAMSASVRLGRTNRQLCVWIPATTRTSVLMSGQRGGAMPGARDGSIRGDPSMSARQAHVGTVEPQCLHRRAQGRLMGRDVSALV